MFSEELAISDIKDVIFNQSICIISIYWLTSIQARDCVVGKIFLAVGPCFKIL